MSASFDRPIDAGALAIALEAVGDRWSLAILHSIALGAARFTDLQIATGAPRGSLTSHLRHLEHRGLIRRVRYQSAPIRWEYLLTDCGAAVIPHASALAEWATGYLARPSQHANEVGAPR